MRSAMCLFLGLAVACSGGGEPAEVREPPAPAPAASTAPPVAPTLVPVAVEAASPRERAVAQLRLLREARRAARAHDYTVAIDRFDQMLRAAPRSPRLACEAGFVAHQAGRDDLAQPRIELALRGFGPDERLAPDMRVPTAMCLYNAGLVYEARGDREAAAGAYDRSLRLRPNGVVRARRASLGAGERDAPADDLVVHAAGEAELIEVLAQTFAGESWDDELAPASADRVEELALPEGGLFRRALLFSVNDHSTMLEDVSYVIALERRAGGYLLYATDAGFVDTQENGSNDASDASLGAMVLDHGLLRIDFTLRTSNDTENEHEWDEHPDYSCYEISATRDEVLDVTLLCSLAASACVRIDRGERRTGQARVDVTCVDEDGDDVAGPSVPPDESGDEGPAYEARVEITDGPVARITMVSGELRERRLAGEHPWTELLGLAATVRAVEPQPPDHED